MQHWQKERRRSVREERRAREERLRQESDDVQEVQTRSHAFKMKAMQRYQKDPKGHSTFKNWRYHKIYED